MKPSISSLSALLLLWGALLLLATASGHLHSPDGEINFRTARSLATTATYAIPPYPAGFGSKAGLDGKEYAQYGPLQPLLAVPHYIIGKITADSLPAEWLSAQADRMSRTVGFYRPLVGGRSEFPGLYPPDHTERVTRIAVSFFNPIVTWLTVMLLLMWSRHFYGDRLAALMLPLVYLLASYAWPHSRPFYSEPLATLFLLLAVVLADRLAGGPFSVAKVFGLAVCVGTSAGLAILTRIDSAVAVFGIAWIAIARLRRKDLPYTTHQKTLAVALGIAAFLVVGGIQPMLNLSRFGALLASGYADQAEGIRFSIPWLDSLKIYLLTPGKSLIAYSPPVLVAILLWPTFFRRDRHLAIGCSLILLGYLLIIGRWQNLGGWCWGPRHLFQMTVFLLLPLPLLFGPDITGRLRLRWTWLLAGTVILGVAIQFMGVLVDYMWPLDRILRVLPPGEDTPWMLNNFGPLIHLGSWHFDRDPDWFLVDLWRSGATGARFVSGVIWAVWILLSVWLVTRASQRFRTRNQG